jgi:methanogenic corrinoid protein MtbC1
MFMQGQEFDARLQSSALGSSSSEARHGPADGRAAGDEECRQSLREVLDTQLIPRLIQSHRVGVARQVVHPAPQPQVQDIESFARLCAAGDRAGATRLIARLRAEGMDRDTVLVDLITPAARYLGLQWEDDRLDFAAVTVGLVLMHEAIHPMGYEYRDGPQQAGAVHRVMLASAPGSQHVLGLAIVSEFFRKAGWQVVVEVSSTSEALCRAVRNEWFDVVGLSVALDSQLPALTRLVRNLKAASRNPLTPVLLGGPVFGLKEMRAASFDAQAVCLDARECVSLAASLLPL